MFPERTGVTLISEEIQVLSPGWDTALHMGLLWFLRQKRKKKGFLDHSETLLLPKCCMATAALNPQLFCTYPKQEGCSAVLL